MSGPEQNLSLPMTLADASAHVTAMNPAYEVTTADIRGVSFRVFKNTPKHIPDMLRRVREIHGDGAAEYLVYQNERWTFDAFCTEAKEVAAGMQSQLGIKQGDRVGIAMRNYPELMILAMAISSLGAVVVFVNAWWTSEELRYGLEDSAPKAVFADGPRMARLLPVSGDVQLVGVRDGEDGADMAYSALQDAGAGADWADVAIDTDDDFAVMYSSGTTGHPKGVVQTHRGAISAVYTWLMAGELIPLLTPPDAPPAPDPGPQATMIVTPLFHVTATHPMFLLSLPFGSKIVLLHKWDAADAVRVIEAENVTRFLGVPTQSAELFAEADRIGASLSSLQYLGSGGAKRPAAQVGPMAQKFPTAAVASGWGMTETNAVGLSISGPDYVARPACAGRLLPPLQDMAIWDEDCAELPVGEVGELVVRSPANMRCYLNKPEATAETMIDGWLRTGDLAMVDADGYVTIVDRKKNIIIRGGENIACLDVEGAIHRHDAVAEACVFAVPDARLGEVVGAGIEFKAGCHVTPAEMDAFLGAHIAKFKIPARYWQVTGPLPRGATDKTDRRALQAQCLAENGPHKEMT